ncbi:hypothetical protein [Pelodictyon luteolum]|uniref:Peptidase S24/S26A/S26B/S26C domain-containing protein n=1 Tax=Chlorobium luteolum (strain DSM 273 / BCRC 81028 / 2530) TaxID=319225 RepID=Q3B6N4_CHLL3|nr:hypothetical protein [Pelodictyon luteolum]ABB22997.1 hypothetical protein Plut_0107 [Pelodictyon luteolum DSM 273]
MFGKLRYPTVKAFADAMQMSASNLQLYMSDRRRPGAPILTRLEAIGCNSSWILTGKGDIIKVGIDSFSRSCRAGMIVKESVSSDLLRIEARGELMTPDSIMEGDALLIDTAGLPEKGDYILKGNNKRRIIKRWELGDKPAGVVIQLIRGPAGLRRM